MDTISIDKILDLAKQLGTEAQEKVQTYIDKLKLAGVTMVNFGDITTGTSIAISNSLHKLAQSAQNLVANFGGFTEQATKLTNTVTDFTTSAIKSIDDMGMSAADLAIAIEPMFGLINKNITGMGKLGDAGYEAGAKLTTAFSAVEPLMSKVLGQDASSFKFISALNDGASRAIGLERELINMTVAQGKVSSVTDETTGKFIDMNNAYRDFVNMSVLAARESGQTVGSMMDLQKAMASIPESLNNAENAVKTARIATAAGRDQLEVAKQLADMYTRLGSSQEDSIASMALIQDKAGDSKLRMEAFNQTVMTVAGSFKMLGDNTVATTNFVGAFDKAFQDSKISPEAMKEVITSIGEGVSRLDTAKKAFISGSTGGPGGLAGAVQMDYAIQTGHADEVIRKTMMAMQNQFGGQVVTLKDAAQNPALAGEFYKQIQYLTQVAGIAKDEDQAKRILEAMKSGVMDILKPGKGEEDKGVSLDRQLARGSGLQEQTNTKLMEIHQTLEATRLRQDEIYLTQLKNPQIAEKLSDLGNMFGVQSQVGFESKKAETAGMRNLMGARESGEYIRPEWKDIIGLPQDSVLMNSLSSAGSLQNLISKKDQTAPVPEVTRPTIPNTITQNITPQRMEPTIPLRPPPGTESGIASVVRGHAPPALHLPETDKFKLPTLDKPEDGKQLEIPPLNITHSFEPIQIDITGIGDSIISKQVDAKLKQSHAADYAQQALGRR